MPSLSSNAKKKARPCGLAEVSESELGRLSLPKLKMLAAAELYEVGWLKIGAAHKGELLAALQNTKREQLVFAKSVAAAIADDQHLVAASTELGSHDGAPKPRKKANESWPGPVVRKAMSSCIHIVPSGSGVIIHSSGIVLTCAHVVAADGDPDENDEIIKPPKRLGRLKTLIDSSGTLHLAACTVCDEAMDVAALQIVWTDGGSETFTAAPLSALTPDPHNDTNAAIACIGNPYDWDLECPAGARPMKMGFRPFHTSAGSITSVSPETDRATGLGGTKHSCWTYWGHSGAPLFNRCGELVAMHNSWDSDNGGQRHAVSLDMLRPVVEVAIARAFKPLQYV